MSVFTQSLFGTNAPTNQVINLGSSVGVNNSGQTFVCYAFAEKKGYSKMGAFTGNGNADGVFVYTGFKPAFLNKSRLYRSARVVASIGKAYSVSLKYAVSRRG